MQHTYEANPGRVWEEDEFWIELSWQIDPTGKLGIRKHFESPYRPGEKITIDEYYRYIFERVPGLPEAAKAKGLDPLALHAQVRRVPGDHNRRTSSTSATDRRRASRREPSMRRRRSSSKTARPVGIEIERR